jgi:hypothetical protein
MPLQDDGLFDEDGDDVAASSPDGEEPLHAGGQGGAPTPTVASPNQVFTDLKIIN